MSSSFSQTLPCDASSRRAYCNKAVVAPSQVAASDDSAVSPSAEEEAECKKFAAEFVRLWCAGDTAGASALMGALVGSTVDATATSPHCFAANTTAPLPPLTPRLLGRVLAALATPVSVPASSSNTSSNNTVAEGQHRWDSLLSFLLVGVGKSTVDASAFDGIHDMFLLKVAAASGILNKKAEEDRRRRSRKDLLPFLFDFPLFRCVLFRGLFLRMHAEMLALACDAEGLEALLMGGAAAAATVGGTGGARKEGAGGVDVGEDEGEGDSKGLILRYSEALRELYDGWDWEAPHPAVLALLQAVPTCDGHVEEAAAPFNVTDDGAFPHRRLLLQLGSFRLAHRYPYASYDDSGIPSAMLPKGGLTLRHRSLEGFHPDSIMHAVLVGIGQGGLLWVDEHGRPVGGGGEGGDVEEEGGGAATMRRQRREATVAILLGGLHSSSDEVDVGGASDRLGRHCRRRRIGGAADANGRVSRGPLLVNEDGYFSDSGATCGDAAEAGTSAECRPQPPAPAATQPSPCLRLGAAATRGDAPRRRMAVP